MFQNSAYNFFKSEQDAISAFNRTFVNTRNVDFDESGFTTGCFGSYGSVYQSNCDFYFVLGGVTGRLEKAVEYFNQQFKNIKLEIIATAKTYIVEAGWNMEIVTEKGLMAKHNVQGAGFVYLLHIKFSEGYEDFAKYCLRVPLGFFIRMYSCYYGNRIDYLYEGEEPTDYIQAALDLSNSHPGNNGSLISDYIVSFDTFMKLDDVALINKKFAKAFTSVKYKYSSVPLYYGTPVRPYSIYWVIEN